MRDCMGIYSEYLLLEEKGSGSYHLYDKLLEILKYKLVMHSG